MKKFEDLNKAMDFALEESENKHQFVIKNNDGLWVDDKMTKIVGEINLIGYYKGSRI